MAWLVALFLSWMQADEVTVRPLRGPTARGTLLTLNEQGVALRTAGGEELQWKGEAIQSVVPQQATTAPAEPVSPAMAAKLDDESLLSITRFALQDGEARVGLASGELSFSGRLIRWVRLHAQDEALSQQWEELIAAEGTADRLVVRKTSGGDEGGAAAKMVLDQLEGIVRSVADGKIAFEFDGDVLDVPLEKVEGIIFRRGSLPNRPDAACVVRDVRGGEWYLRSLQRVDDREVRFQTVAGVSGSLPWSDVAVVDFSSGNLTYLSDLKPESVDWRPYLVTPATPTALAKWFGVRRDQANDGSVLTLGEQSFEKGLSIHSRTLLTYRLTREYRHLQAVVGIDERFRGPNRLKLSVTGDNRELLSRDIRGTDPPFEMDVDITGIRRLRVLVDFGDDRSDAGDHLILGNARLTK